MKKILFLALVAFSACKTTKQTAFKQPKFETNICRGNGQVVVIDSTQTIIRIKGIVLKNDTIATGYHYVLALGSFNKKLHAYNGKHILFECEGMIPNNFFPGEDVLPSIKGCIETDNSYTTK